MTTVLLAFITMGVLMLGMAVGVLAGRKPISGSCGGMKALGMDVDCEICGGNADLCETSRSSDKPGTQSVQTFDPGHKSD